MIKLIASDVDGTLLRGGEEDVYKRQGQTEELEVTNNLENPELGSRRIPFGRELYIEREDFMEEPPRKYFRMFPGNEVRLMNAYFVKCTGFEKDENGKVTVVHGTYDPASKGGNSPDGRKEMCIRDRMRRSLLISGSN